GGIVRLFKKQPGSGRRRCRVALVLSPEEARIRPRRPEQYAAISDEHGVDEAVWTSIDLRLHVLERGPLVSEHEDRKPSFPGRSVITARPYGHLPGDRPVERSPCDGWAIEHLAHPFECHLHFAFADCHHG